MLKPYTSTASSPEITSRLFELHAHSNSTKALMSALGDYWTSYFKDYEDLVNVTTGCVVSLGTEYRRLLDMILQSNIVDIPCRDTLHIDLLYFDESEAEIDFAKAPSSTPKQGIPTKIVFRNTALKDVSFLTTSLFESPVVLERGVHFTIDEHSGDLEFLVDIFNDENIVHSAYRFDDYPHRKVLFWATDIVLSSSHIYDRYGRFLYKKANDSERYKWMVTALMYFYANNKSVKNVENVLNILYGIPFASKDGEVVKDIYLVDGQLNRIGYKDDDSYYCIETDYRKYYVYSYADISVSVGEKLSMFQLLARFHKVDDYITSPLWYKNATIPSALFVTDQDTVAPSLREELLDNILKYNLIYIQLKVSWQTWDTYMAQIDEIHKIVKAGIPVYLYPCIGTVFRISFEDKVDSDDTFSVHLEMNMASQYSPSNRTYNGACYYNAHPEFDHGSVVKVDSFDKLINNVLFDGKVRYCGPLGNLRAVHRPFAEGAELFNGLRTYDGKMTVMHDAEREIFVFDTIGLTATDTFSYSDQDGSLLVYTRYNGDISHNTSNVFGLNNERVFEVRSSVLISSADEMPIPSDEFTYTATRRS